MILIYFSGKVQGVFFRATTKKYADSIGLKGYAKNLPDGRVEVLIQGDKTNANQLIHFLKKSDFSITEIEIQTIDHQNQYTDFSIL